MEALDLPSKPEEPGRAEHTGDRGAARPKARDLPDPDERGRLYDKMDRFDEAWADFSEANRLVREVQKRD